MSQAVDVADAHPDPAERLAKEDEVTAIRLRKAGEGLDLVHRYDAALGKQPQLNSYSTTTKQIEGRQFDFRQWFLIRYPCFPKGDVVPLNESEVGNGD